jgi:hypothetical protein
VFIYDGYTNKKNKKNMIYFKIYFTLIFVTLIVAGVTWSLMNSDNKRSDLWFKISYISWILTLVMIIVGALTAIWFF